MTASTALVVIDPAICPACGASLEVEHVDEPALVRHGGYGATRRIVTRYCARHGCSYTLRHEVCEVRP